MCVWLLQGVCGLCSCGLHSVVSVANVSFERTNLLSERSEQNHFMNWFVLFFSSVELSREHAHREWNCRDSLMNLRRTTQPACNLLACTQRTVRTWFNFALWFIHDLQTYCTQRTDVILVHVLCRKWRCVTHSLTHSGQRSWFTFSNRTAKISAVLLTSM